MKYKVRFKLTEVIHCERDTDNRDDIEFEFGKCKEQKIIRGFTIAVEAEDCDEAERIATKRADKLTGLLSATSGTFSEWTLCGSTSSDGTISTIVTLAYSIRNNAVLNISDDLFRQIVDSDHPLNTRLGYLRDARRAERAQDWPSVIRYLDHEKNGKYKPLRCLRNLLEHASNLLTPTITDIKKWHPDLKLDGKKFDPKDENNTKKIKARAEQFLKDAHQAMHRDLTNQKLQ